MGTNIKSFGVLAVGLGVGLALSAACVSCVGKRAGDEEQRGGGSGGQALDDAAQDDADDADDARHVGFLVGGLMGIGGEHTGWMLRRDDERALEVDVSAVRDEATRLEERRVSIQGEVIEKQYVERGPTPVLVAREISAAD